MSQVESQKDLHSWKLRRIHLLGILEAALEMETLIAIKTVIKHLLAVACESNMVRLVFIMLALCTVKDAQWNREHI
jgi:hypothetical protein